MAATDTAQTVVAIVGRPNVGKSTLFNRLVGHRSSIVHDMPGVTRDRTYGETEWLGRRFQVTDTGGMVEQPLDPLVYKMQAQIRAAIDEAAAVLFVVDVTAGPTPADAEIADHLRKVDKPVYLVANKADNPARARDAAEFYSLGFGRPYPVSALHGSGVAELLDRLAGLVPEQTVQPAEDTSEIRVAVIGRPNVGKSSFINSLLREQRVLVDDQPGTTRDAVDVGFRWQQRHFTLIDTAGMRKRARVRKSVERFSVARALRSIRRADVCALMIDITADIVDQDIRIAQRVFAEGRGLVLVVNKWDTVEDKEARFPVLRKQLRGRTSLFAHVPFVTTSCTERTRLFEVLTRVMEVYAALTRRVDTPELNRFIANAVHRNQPPVVRGRRGRIYYVTQAETRPPVFVLFVNDPAKFSQTYVRYLENMLRNTYGFDGVPLRFELRGR